MKAIRQVIVLGVLGGLLIGCGGGSGASVAGYTFEPLYPADVKTVAVPIWTVGKDVYRRGLEFRLTEAVKKSIETDTGYKISTRERADTVLEGTITKVRQQVLRVNPDTGFAGQLELTIVVSFTWTDLRSSEVRVRRDNLRVSGKYIRAAPFNEDFFQGSEDVINRLARRIVESMEKDF